MELLNRLDKLNNKRADDDDWFTDAMNQVSADRSHDGVMETFSIFSPSMMFFSYLTTWPTGDRNLSAGKHSTFKLPGAERAFI